MVCDGPATGVLHVEQLNDMAGVHIRVTPPPPVVDELRVVFCPFIMVTFALTTATGNGFERTLTVAVATHPFESVTVTEYVP